MGLTAHLCGQICVRAAAWHVRPFGVWVPLRPGIRIMGQSISFEFCMILPPIVQW